MLTILRKILPEHSFLRRWYSAINGVLAAAWYGFPARSLLCIGVTGTDGKTTTTEMIAHLLRASGKKVLSVSTVATVLGARHMPTDKRTTPSPWILQRLLQKAKKEGIQYAVLEVSSHALVQKRIFGIPFSAAVLTNITPEHLDYHGTFQQYTAAKKLLFTKYLKEKGAMIINADDKTGKKWMKECENKENSLLLYSSSPQKNALFSEDIHFLSAGMETVLVAENGTTTPFFLPLFGAFNIQNAMAAIQTARFFGISLQKAAEFFSSFSGVKGRMQPVSVGQDFLAIIDFAYAAESLKNALFSARKMSPSGKVIVVFGSPGSHPDIAVRKKMGEVAAAYADVVVVTDDEPYTENPADIRAHILAGARGVTVDVQQKTAEIHEIPNREQAMEFACRNAKKGDVVLVAGMGHLSSRNIGGKEISWNDAEVLRKILLSL